MGFRAPVYELPSNVVRMDNPNIGASLDLTLTGDINISSRDNNTIATRNSLLRIDKNFQLEGTILYPYGLEIASITPNGGAAPALPANPVGYYYVGGMLVPFYMPPDPQPIPIDKAIIRSIVFEPATTTNPVNIQQCPGIRVGDILVLAVGIPNNVDPSSIPAGFALQQTETTALNKRLNVYTKTVTAADVALTQYSIGNTTGLKFQTLLVAVARHNGLEYSIDGHLDAGTTLNLAQLDPAIAGDLFIAIKYGGGPIAGSSVQTINNNPVWFRWVADGSWFNFGVWTGNYLVDTPTGNIQFGSGATDYNGCVLAFAPAV